ncbi:TPA: hypothetical protein ACPWZ0_003075 [Salmonella enterica subsp. enterica serovar Vietnam]|nr:hypothetical protein [Salmonella enterica]
MDIIKCIGFLGYSSVFPELDDFLLSNGIKKRPQGVGGADHLKTPSKDVVLSFEERDVFEHDSLLPAKSDGKYIFSYLEVHSENEGSLPYGLTFKDSLDDLEKKLGKNIKDNKVALPEKRTITFFHDSLLIIVFMNVKDEIFIIKFMTPTIYNEKNLGVKI